MHVKITTSGSFDHSGTLILNCWEAMWYVNLDMLKRVKTAHFTKIHMYFESLKASYWVYIDVGIAWTHFVIFLDIMIESQGRFRFEIVT